MAGKKGRSGRKSHYQELADAKELRDLLFKDHNQETLENKISKGKFSLKDRLTLNGMEGDSRVLTKLVDKIWPDGLDLSSNGRPLLIEGTKDEEDDE